MICHSNERPFECETCGSSFKTKGHLKSHEIMHADVIITFKCETCFK